MDNSTVRKDIGYIGARLREPSTYNALAILAGVLGGAVGLKLDPTVGTAIAGVGMSVGALIGALLPEKTATVKEVIAATAATDPVAAAKLNAVTK